MKRMLVAVLFLGKLTACDSGGSPADGPNSCVPGAITACPCGLNTGAQTCLSDGTFGPCDCPSECAQNTDCPATRPICAPTRTCVECRSNSDCSDDAVCNDAGECVSAAELASQVSAGSGHTCALTAAGGVQCWGHNSDGQLGDGSTTDSATPVSVSGLSTGVVAIGAGHFHTCAVTTAGGVQCWGSNEFGRLGDGSTTDRTEPVDVSGLSTGVMAIGAGELHTCAVTTAGGVQCWGHNEFGQLGDGSTTDRTEPMDVSGLSTGVMAIWAGELHTCAVTTAGGVKCWGYNENGQLGDGSTDSRTEPMDVSGLSTGVMAIDAGNLHTCAVTTAGGVRCWGGNGVGQLGDGSTTDRREPVDVSGLASGAKAIAAGNNHTCALATSGGVRCWGNNYWGQLGDGSTDDSATPVEVSW